jgi:hypothetical protein
MPTTGTRYRTSGQNRQKVKNLRIEIYKVCTEEKIGIANKHHKREIVETERKAHSNPILEFTP